MNEVRISLVDGSGSACGKQKLVSATLTVAARAVEEAVVVASSPCGIHTYTHIHAHTHTKKEICFILANNGVEFRYRGS